MSQGDRVLDPSVLYEVLMGVDRPPGVFEQLIGFRTATTVYKGVHLVSDLVQSALGDASK